MKKRYLGKQGDGQSMQIDKSESERILKSVQANKVNAVTLRKNDTLQNKKQEMTSLTSLVTTKITQGTEVTVIVIATQ